MSKRVDRLITRPMSVRGIRGRTELLLRRASWGLHSAGPDRGLRAIYLGQLAERIGDWACSIALTVLVYRLTGALPPVAIALLVQVLPGLFVWSPGGPLGVREAGRFAAGAALLRALIVASLILVVTGGHLWWAYAGGALLGGLRALADAQRSARLAGFLTGSRLRIANARLGQIERGGLIAGSVVAALAIAVWDEWVVFGLAALLIAIGAVLARGLDGQAAVLLLVRPAVDDVWGRLRRDRVLRLVVVGLFAGAALAMGLRVTLVEAIVDGGDPSGATYALLIGAVGLGALAGPIPIPRLLGRLGLGLLVGGGVAVQAAGLMVTTWTSAPVVIGAILFVAGLVAGTNDLLTATAMRRLVPVGQLEGVVRLLIAAVTAGQTAGLIAVAALASLWTREGAVYGLAVGCLALTLVTLAGAGSRGLVRAGSIR